MLFEGRLKQANLWDTLLQANNPIDNEAFPKPAKDAGLPTVIPASQSEMVCTPDSDQYTKMLPVCDSAVATKTCAARCKVLSSSLQFWFPAEWILYYSPWLELPTDPVPSLAHLWFATTQFHPVGCKSLPSAHDTPWIWKRALQSPTNLGKNEASNFSFQGKNVTLESI